MVKENQIVRVAPPEQYSPGPNSNLGFLSGVFSRTLDIILVMAVLVATLITVLTFAILTPIAFLVSIFLKRRSGNSSWRVAEAS